MCVCVSSYICHTQEYWCNPQANVSACVCVCVCVYVRVCGGDGGQAFKGIAAALHRSLEHMNPAQVRELVESQ